MKKRIYKQVKQAKNPFQIQKNRLKEAVKILGTSNKNQLSCWDGEERGEGKSTDEKIGSFSAARHDFRNYMNCSTVSVQDLEERNPENRDPQLPVSQALFSK